MPEEGGGKAAKPGCAWEIIYGQVWCHVPYLLLPHSHLPRPRAAAGLEEGEGENADPTGPNPAQVVMWEMSLLDLCRDLCCLGGQGSRCPPITSHIAQPEQCRGQEGGVSVPVLAPCGVTRILGSPTHPTVAAKHAWAAGMNEWCLQLEIPSHHKMCSGQKAEKLWFAGQECQWEHPPPSLPAVPHDQRGCCRFQGCQNARVVGWVQVTVPCTALGAASWAGCGAGGVSRLECSRWLLGSQAQPSEVPAVLAFQPLSLAVISLQPVQTE